MSDDRETWYETIIIGTGQAGKPLARALAAAGRRTAILEADRVGGTCINYGCTPTKTLVAGARVAYLARRGADYGVSTGRVSVDVSTARERKDRVVLRFREGSQRSLEQASNLDLIFGEARFAGPKEIEVTARGGASRRLSAGAVVINAGGRPRVPDLEGLSSIPFLDSSSIMTLDELPARLVVLGGGYIGLEFAQMFRRFGSEVIVVQRGPRLLSREDDDVADEMASILRADGVEVLLEAAALRAERAPGGAVGLRVRHGGEEVALRGSHLLVAAGRVPNTDRLNLQAAGVRTDRSGFVVVNEMLETSAPGVYAAGDVKGGPQFTHISYDDFRILRDVLLHGAARTIHGRLVPYTVYTDPQLGRVGLTEREARAQGREIRVAKMPMDHVARAIEMSETRGFIKAVVDARTDRILGCAVLGVEGGELMSMLEIAMMGGLPYTALRDGIFAHPTLAECLNNLFASFSD